LAIGSLQEVTIEKLVYGGDGLAHIGSQANLHPISPPLATGCWSASPNWRGTMRAGSSKGIITPSASRRTPPCPYFRRLRRMSVQHLDYSAQLQTKREFLHESLRRIGSIEWPVRSKSERRPSSEYRSRAEVKIERAATGETRIGYYQAGTHEVCEIESCPLLLPAANRELQRLHTEKVAAAEGRDAYLSDRR
jgi:23S rRNA (uracil1939-C5)-methyltransferase